MKNLEGKVAIITGGNSGIGYATAQRLKAQGATVAITGRSKEKVNRAASELGVSGYVADVGILSQIDQLTADIKRDLGRVDILFVNAGIFLPSPIGQLDEEAFDRQMGINFKGAVFTIEKFLPLMERGASIVNLSSINAYTGMPNTAVYAASKAALNSYMRTASTELARKGIRINSVNPGPVSTPIFGKTGMPQEMLDGFAAAMIERVPLKRFGEPAEIAKLVGFLASDDASFITGAEYNIDGGMNINPGIG